jgi:hypothetical protein
VLALAAVSCGSKGAVTVSAIIDQPELSVEAASPLSSGLRGGFRLHLELGKVAPEAADVSLDQATFSLVRADNQSSLVVLRTAPDRNGPIHLEPGAQADIRFTVTDGRTSTPVQAITLEQAAAACASGNAEIVGTVGDTAHGPGTVRSSSLTVGGPGCPP